MTGGTRRRPKAARRSTAAAIALMLGGAGLIAVNTYASATETNAAETAQLPAGAAGSTIDCPEVADHLPKLPEKALAGVSDDLAAMDTQITDAYQRLTRMGTASGDAAGEKVKGEVLDPLRKSRAESIGRITDSIDRTTGRPPSGLDDLAACEVKTAPGGTAGDSSTGDAGSGDAGNADKGEGNGGGTAPPSAGNGNGPDASDFVDIRTVKPNVSSPPAARADASRGSFLTDCGVNGNKNYNTDNVIAAPGVTNGAHHLHDYVGNQDINAFSNNDTFAAAATSCKEQGDKSAYYWPVVRVQDGTQDFDQNSDGGGKEGNVGRILTAKQAEIKYVGSPASKVVAMPKFLRIITGDAKAFTNGPANANAHFSCTGFENKVQLTDKYPICPKGSDVVRSFSFQSCWDGQNTDSANHRTHMAFADADGNCANGFKAIPQLTMRLVYDVPAPTVENGQVKNAYAVDGFPEQLHKPINDHDDFINIMDQSLMDQVVDCLNKGRTCGAGAPPANGTGDDKGDDTGGKGDDGKNDDGGTKDDGKGGDDGKEDDNGGKGDTGNGGATETPGKGGTQNGQNGQGDAKGSDDGAVTSGGTADTKAGAGADTPKSESTVASDARRTEAGTAPDGSASPSAVSRAEGGDDQDSVGSVNPVPQAEGSQGSLAETGSQLWPAAAGALMLCAGLVVLLRSRRYTARR
ncbi:DUF1996 domain-containing protein [Streptomyces sp. B3I8]|uniref:DUF1996 domain-containing protein n=1 Tax=Streptomyces sp. B3I8 TaxID=3042303 RepID=UPI00278651EC|nr:DUF1996 domain-containing protein [Streptomyces sp. B3I8]MDQ0791080.1 hypothetical protein [Streptomyces sp. B3I8]